MRSSLYLGRSAADEGQLRSMAAAAWHKRGVVVVLPEQILNWQDRALIEAIAAKLYGKRGKDDEYARGG